MTTDLPSWVYILIDPRYDDVRYVGVTKNPSQRYHQHKHKDNRVGEWMRYLETQGYKAEMTLLQRVASHSREHVEARWMRRFEQWGANLLNENEPTSEGSYLQRTDWEKGAEP